MFSCRPLRSRRVCALLLLCLILGLPACVRRPVFPGITPAPTVAVPAPTFEAASARARDLLQSLRRRDYAAAYATFDASMKGAISAARLAAVWEGLLAQGGDYQETTAVKTAAQVPYVAVILTLRLEKALIDMRVVVDTNSGLVSGLFFTPASGAPTAAASDNYAAPAYVDSRVFTDKEVTVGSGEWAQPGTLSLPRGDGPFPAVVLVQPQAGTSSMSRISRLAKRL